MEAPLALLLLLLLAMASAHAGTVSGDLHITWGDGRGKMLRHGDGLTLSLDRTSGSGFASGEKYLFGSIQIQIKLVSGDSAGTVTSYYLASGGAGDDEIDYEFLGNVSGEPYTIHTNVYTRGKGGREQQFRAWFDPTKDFHTYSILWNPHHIMFSVDGTPIREFKNHEAQGVAFPRDQPMRLYSSIWNADDWATRGGLVKTDWSRAPFKATYRNFSAEACVWSDAARASRCGGVGWLNQELDVGERRRLKWVRENHMIYDYCKDRRRFPRPPPECSLSS